ncbi:hypothetical protein BN126310055 [Stenotrophomonas thermophila]|nr:hypothetical protein BN126310055 [Stenotrophomonas maltophilia]
MTNQADEALLRLLMAGGALAPRRALLQAAGRAEIAIAQGAANWRAHGCTPEQCAALDRPDARALAVARRWLEDDNQHLLAFTDPAFPRPCWMSPIPPLRCSSPATPAGPGAHRLRWSAAARQRRADARWQPGLPAASSTPGWR